MKKENDISNFEWYRQIFHIFLGIAIAALLLYDFIDKNIILMLIILGLIISYISKKTKIPVVYDLLKKFERNEEIEKFPGKGVIFYFIGAYVALLLFPKDIAMASIMVLAFGDSVSHIYGLHFGKTRYSFSKTKFIEGTIAGFIAGFIGALVFARWYESLLASLAAVLVEAIEIKIGAQQVDDNLIIPFVAGAVIWIIRLV